MRELSLTYGERKKTQRYGKIPNSEIIINVAPVILFIVYLTSHAPVCPQRLVLGC